MLNLNKLVEMNGKQIILYIGSEVNILQGLTKGEKTP